MKPLIVAAVFALATFAQPWEAGDTLHQNTTSFAGQYLESQAQNFDMSMQGPITLAMYCQGDTAMTSGDGTAILPVCSGKAATPPAARRGYRHGARHVRPAPVGDL